MKSGIVTRRDPYLMDPSLMVDPNLILDYGSSLKDEVIYNQYDPFLDLINYNDTQLESIILDSDLCGEGENACLGQNESDFDEFLKGLDLYLDNESPIQAKQEADVSTFIINESDIANYEEVYTCDTSVVSPSAASEVTEPDFEDHTDSESVHSYATQSTSSTLKRKISNDDDDYVEAAPKRRKPTRRNKRVQDERVKNQNKVAAMKYRKKKRDEKSVMDIALEEEEEKNKKLKSSLEELKVNIDVLKELLGKYLSPTQLNVNLQ